MKKIMLILFLFLSFYLCYIIYNLTEDTGLYCLVLGDSTADNSYLSIEENITTYNNYYIDKDYRIIDLLNTIKYNKEKNINDKQISIHQLLKKSDIIVLSIGMNDIYYKLNDNTKNIYTYINNMINNMEELLKEINRYNYQKVIVLNYYNTTNKYNDIFTYLNYKLEKITKEANFEYIDLEKYIGNNQNLLEKTDNFYLNDQGYKEINQLIVEKIKNSWYNITRIYYYDLF